MTLPVTVPNTFANATTSIPLANLDANFTTIYAAVNGIGNGSETLANVQVSGGTLSNVTLDNVTVDVETLSNVTLVDVTVTSGNATFTTANATTIDTTNIEVTNIKAKDGTASVSIADSTGIPTISKATVIETTDNTNAALRITQTGTGDALLVEDAANPDSTPVVIDASGRIIKGATSAIVSGIISNPGASTQIHGVTTFREAAFELASWVASTSSDAAIVFTKSPSGAAGTQTIVANNEPLGKLRFGGSDGVTVLEAARIEAAVDGTPGTNDMPGRLVFSTTADGASSLTERMRIDSAGRVGLGATPISTARLLAGGTFPSDSNVSVAVAAQGTIPSTTTSQAQIFRSNPFTQAASFTLTSLSHYLATQGTIGAGSAVTSQYGVQVDSTLTGATNNYGFFSNIASGTGRFNFYANGTADNYFAGQVQLGAGTVSAPALSTTGDTNTGIYFPAADNIGFATNGVIRGRWTTDGLCFGSDTAAANALDDYEEGTFTPTLFGATTAGTTTYVFQFGNYTKIGRQVTVQIFLNASAATGTGEWRMGGLPFTVSVNGYSVPIVSGLNWGGGTYVAVSTIAAGTDMEMYYCADDANGVNQQMVNESQLYSFTLTYFV